MINVAKWKRSDQVTNNRKEICYGTYTPFSLFCLLKEDIFLLFLDYNRINFYPYSYIMEKYFLTKLRQKHSFFTCIISSYVDNRHRPTAWNLIFELEVLKCKNLKNCIFKKLIQKQYFLYITLVTKCTRAVLTLIHSVRKQANN